jgi:hypothetical protein
MIRSNFSLEQYHAFSDVSGPSDDSVSGVAPPPSPED